MTLSTKSRIILQVTNNAMFKCPWLETSHSELKRKICTRRENTMNFTMKNSSTQSVQDEEVPVQVPTVLTSSLGQLHMEVIHSIEGY